MESSFWHFTAWKEAKDSDWGEEASSGISIQPDHGLNVARPNKRRKKRKKHLTDAKCKTCNIQLVNGSCPSCNWGEANRPAWTDNYPIDPVKDDRAGIRASKYIPNGADIDKSAFKEGDWYYEPAPQYGSPIKFWINYPATNSARLVTKEELDSMLQAESDQMQLWEEA
jgi:hypothetical protein